MRSTIKLDRWSPPLTRQRSLADVGPATGSVWIVRHGERVDVVNPDWLVTAERPHDPPLTEFGCAQAAATGEYLLGLGDRVDFVYTSPVLRCVLTASAIARGLGGVPLRVELGPKDMEGGCAMLARRDTGAKESCAWDSLAARVPALLQEMWRYPVWGPGVQDHYHPKPALVRCNK
jgi:broad specificity phosphatase PhoE